MKNFKRLISTLIAFMAITILTSTGASASWKQDSNNHWNYESASGSNLTGWNQIDGQWYYFNDNEVMQTGWINSNGNSYYFYGNGTMAHDTTVEGYYLNSNGAWTTSTPTSTIPNNSGSTTSAVGDTQSQTVYVSRQGIYHTSPTAHGMKYYTTMSRTDAESKGYRACKICY